MSALPEMHEMVERWINNNKVRFEGEKGVQGVEKMIGILGYSSIEDFLRDNSSFVESFYDWLSDRNVPEWQENLLSEFDEDEKFGDDEEEDDDSEE